MGGGGGEGGRLMIDQHLKDVLRPEGKEGIREGGRGEVGGSAWRWEGKGGRKGRGGKGNGSEETKGGYRVMVHGERE